MKCKQKNEKPCVGESWQQVNFMYIIYAANNRVFLCSTRWVTKTGWGWNLCPSKKGHIWPQRCVPPPGSCSWWTQTKDTTKNPTFISPSDSIVQPYLSSPFAHLLPTIYFRYKGRPKFNRKSCRRNFLVLEIKLQFYMNSSLKKRWINHLN